MAKSGRDPEDTGHLVNELERLRTDSQRVRRQCDKAREHLREAWQWLQRDGKLDEGLSKRGLSGRKDERKRSTKSLKTRSRNEAGS